MKLISHVCIHVLYEYMYAVEEELWCLYGRMSGVPLYHSLPSYPETESH